VAGTPYTGRFLPSSADLTARRRRSTWSGSSSRKARSWPTGRPPLPSPACAGAAGRLGRAGQAGARPVHGCGEI